jgi:ketosteroid isomerase-like protein
MNGNEQIVQRFYTAFQQLDYTTMQDCYSENAIFNDPVFGILQGKEVSSMWEMLCKNAKDFSLEFSNIESLDEEYITCHWKAAYTFSATGRKVVNNIKAHMRIQEGKITEHSDKFDLWKWSRQALGIPGLLLGWSNFIQNKVHKTARKNLEKFMVAKAVK